MKRVLQITHSLAKNGTETFIMNLYRNIDREKVQFDFLIQCATKESFKEEAEKLGANVYVIPYSRLGLIKHWAEINSFFKENAHKYSAVHFNGMSFCGAEVLLLAKKYGIPKRIVHTHSNFTYGFHNVLNHKFIRKYIDEIATDYLACSDTAKEWGYNGNRRAYKEAIVIPNGIDLNRYSFNPIKRKSLRNQFGIESEFVLGTVGRLSKVKNQSFLLDILKEIQNIRPDSKLIIIGEGELKNELEEKAKRLGIFNQVIFTGTRNDVGDLLNIMDSFILPSLYEGLPFVGIEAQANGLPSFFSDTVSKQILLTPNAQQISLNLTPREWAKRIIDNPYSMRWTDISSTKLVNYSIAKTAQLMEEIYDA